MIQLDDLAKITVGLLVALVAFFGGKWINRRDKVDDEVRLIDKKIEHLDRVTETHKHMLGNGNDRFRALDHRCDFFEQQCEKHRGEHKDEHKALEKEIQSVGQTVVFLREDFHLAAESMQSRADTIQRLLASKLEVGLKGNTDD